jgi:predicted porin
MKTTKQFALATLAVAASAAVHAQSTTNVSLYGIADAYVSVAHGASTDTTLGSGGLSGSRIGLRGTEDLGGGLRALFTLESGVNINDGTNGQSAFWGRQAFVGLGSATAGTLTLGRQYGSIYALSSDFSAFSNGPTGPSTAVIGGFGGYEPVRGGNSSLTGVTSASGNGGPARVNNSVKYETPSFGGFRAGALWGLGEVSGGTTDNRVADVYARYTAGPVDAMVSYVDDKADVTGLQVRTISAAGAYDFGGIRALAGVIDVNDRSAVNADGRGYWIGTDYRFGPNLVKAQYLINDARGSLDGRTRALGAGYEYALSKRTSLYTSLTHFKNDGTGYIDRWASGTVPTGLTSVSDRNITEAVAGIRHTF